MALTPLPPRLVAAPTANDYNLLLDYVAQLTVQSLGIDPLVEPLGSSGDQP